MGVRLAQELVGVLALSDYLEAGVGQKAREPLAQQHAVLGDRYAHGISALTRVPPPRGVQTLSRPSKRLDAVGKSAQAAAALGVGAAHAVVDHLDDERAVRTGDVHA